MTALDLITSSLRLIGVGAAGETLSASEAADGLAALNALLDSWSNQALLIPSVTSETFALIPGQASYTMGPGGNFDTSRPQKIETARLQVAGGTSTIDYPIRILTEAEYAAIPLKSLQSNYPTTVYPDKAFALDMLTFWPVPSQANNVVIDSAKPLNTFGTLTGALSLPPGYVRALRFNLAVDLAPEYGKAPREDVIALAAESKAAIKRMNTRPRYLKVDNALLGRGSMGGSGEFSIFAGGSSDDDIVDGGTV